jgi:hypothetical protein
MSFFFFDKFYFSQVSELQLHKNLNFFLLYKFNKLKVKNYFRIQFFFSNFLLFLKEFFFVKRSIISSKWFLNCLIVGRDFSFLVIFKLNNIDTSDVPSFEREFLFFKNINFLRMFFKYVDVLDFIFVIDENIGDNFNIFKTIRCYNIPVFFFTSTLRSSLLFYFDFVVLVDRSFLITTFFITLLTNVLSNFFQINLIEKNKFNIKNRLSQYKYINYYKNRSMYVSRYFLNYIFKIYFFLYLKKKLKFLPNINFNNLTYIGIRPSDKYPQVLGI